jgi:hypothetical protein
MSGAKIDAGRVRAMRLNLLTAAFEPATMS